MPPTVHRAALDRKAVGRRLESAPAALTAARKVSLGAAKSNAAGRQPAPTKNVAAACSATSDEAHSKAMVGTDGTEDGARARGFAKIQTAAAAGRPRTRNGRDQRGAPLPIGEMHRSGGGSRVAYSTVQLSWWPLSGSHPRLPRRFFRGVGPTHKISMDGGTRTGWWPWPVCRASTLVSKATVLGAPSAPHRRPHVPAHFPCGKRRP